jgi:hypothetical protein
MTPNRTLACDGLPSSGVRPLRGSQAMVTVVSVKMLFVDCACDGLPVVDEAVERLSKTAPIAAAFENLMKVVEF